MSRSAKSRAGFTLIETLAALAITATIILATGALLYQSVFFFDRGTRNVDRSEQLALAIDTLTRDFGAARFIMQQNAGGTKTAFTGAPESEDGAAKVLFITGGGREAGPQGEEVVSLTVERGDEQTQLVRRRVPWLGPRVHLEDVQPRDPVILLKGKFSISLRFSELTKEGKIIWYDRWTGEKGLPRSIRVNVRDDEGADLLVGAEFPIRADASAACAAGAADCLSPVAKTDRGAKSANSKN